MLKSWTGRERLANAVVVALIARADAEKQYLPAGYPSMFAYCVGELRLAEDAAYLRIEVARKALEFPAVLDALEDGRIHLTAVRLLAPYLTSEHRAYELIAAAAHKSKAEIKLMLAGRFPRTEDLPLVQALPAPPQLGPDRVETASEDKTACRQLGPDRVQPSVPPTKTEPIAIDRYHWQLTVARRVQEKFERARDLLSHEIPSGDMAEVIERCFEALIEQKNKKKFATTKRPRSPKRGSPANPRTIPAHVRGAVLERDQGRCTFVGDGGHRCGSRRYLEFDHITPVARGGDSTEANLRLRCRAHNQLEAERAFGEGFMQERRENRRTEEIAKEETARAESERQTRDLISGLRELGFRATDAKRAAESSASLSGATLEQRMRAALQYLCPRRRTYVGPTERESCSVVGP